MQIKPGSELENRIKGVSDREVRQFAVIASLALPIFISLYFKSLLPVMFSLVPSILIGTSAWLCPKAIRPVYSFAKRITFPIGFLASEVFLFAFFIGVITPIACLLRISGRDSLHLGPDRTESYWQKRKPSSAPRTHLRRF